MNAAKESDIRRALYALVDSGYSAKQMQKVLKAMISEIEEEKEERQADREMGYR